MRKPHTYLPRTTAVTKILGAEISIARRERRITQPELAERAGIALTTLRSVEHGVPTVAIGIVFEVAHLVGLDLLAESADLAGAQSRSADRLRLLPARVRNRAPVDDNF